MGRRRDARGDHARAPDAEAPLEANPIGSYLARQRALRGISLEELSELTRIPVRSLVRLESGLYDGDTDGFTRGFVRAVAQSLGLEPDDTVARILHEPTAADYVRSASLLPRRLLLLGFGLLLVAGVAGFAWALASRLAAADSQQFEYSYRRDSIRLLAEAQRDLDRPTSGSASIVATEGSVEAPPLRVPAAAAAASASAPID